MIVLQFVIVKYIVFMPNYNEVLKPNEINWANKTFKTYCCHLSHYTIWKMEEFAWFKWSYS